MAAMSSVLSVEKTDRQTGLDSYFNKINSARVLCAYSDMLAGRNSAEQDRKTLRKINHDYRVASGRAWKSK
jgi:hypothetical protein